MSEHEAETQAEGCIYAVVTRADGTVEDLGCISSFEPTEADIAFMKKAQKRRRFFNPFKKDN